MTRLARIALGSIPLALGLVGSASAGIVGSDHDLSGMPASSEVCVYCHTPHQATVSGPLWNRDDPAGPFTMYSSVSIDMIIAGAPQGGSLVCLSCHDGSIALDSFGGAPGTEFMEADHQVGPDLSADHPISVTYDPSADIRFFALATVQASPLRLYGTSNDQVECATCHDPHDETFESFLRMDNSGSGICLTCHDM